MMPRLEAHENLREFQVLWLANSDCDNNYRKGILSRWEAIARGDDPDYDEAGRKMLYGSKAIRQWMMLEGGFDEGEIE